MDPSDSSEEQKRHYSGSNLPGHHRGQGTGKKPDPEICGYERTEPQGKE